MSCGYCHSCGGWQDIGGNYCSVCMGTWGPKAEEEMMQAAYEADMRKQQERDMALQMEADYTEYLRQQEILFREFAPITERAKEA